MTRITVPVSQEIYEWLAAKAAKRPNTGKGAIAAELLEQLYQKEKTEKDPLLQALHLQMKECTICGKKAILEQGMCQSCQEDDWHDHQREISLSD